MIGSAGASASRMFTTMVVWQRRAVDGNTVFIAMNLIDYS